MSVQPWSGAVNRELPRSLGSLRSYRDGTVIWPCDVVEYPGLMECSVHYGPPDAPVSPNHAAVQSALRGSRGLI
jgi:hypothetical protein